MAQDTKAIVSTTGELNRRRALRGLSGAGVAAMVAALAPAGAGAAQQGLTEEEAAELADRFVAAFNRGGLDAFDGLIAEGAPVHWFWPIPAEGPRHLAVVVGLVRGAFPDVTIAVDELLVSGNWLTALGTVSGTHTGTLLGVPPTNRSFAIDVIVVARTAEGTVEEIWIQYDLAHLAVQLGALQDAAQALLGGGAIQGATPPATGAPLALDELLEIDGVVFAVEFGADGSLVDYRSEIDIPQAEIEQAAAAGPSVRLVLDLVAQRYSEISVLEWGPPAWAVYSGGENWTTVFAGNVALIAETAAVDFNALYEAVVGPR